MKVFHCDHCQQLVFFENVQCTSCLRRLAYLPDLDGVASLDDAGDGSWTSPWSRAAGRRYRLCQNYSELGICNWAVSADDPNPLCKSCRLTEIIPNLARPGFEQGWRKLESAKRRLICGLSTLGLPAPCKLEDPDNGVTFQFVSDVDSEPGRPVLTGHDNGIIVVNIAEADDAERERRRLQLHEPYRTLLGHFRHEIGHYYWDRLVRDSPRLEDFRRLFGDERADYAQALQSYYDQGGPPPDWQRNYISAYATCHPWEDWAESWAHYLHMTDTLETAIECGVSITPPNPSDPALAHDSTQVLESAVSFNRMIEEWFPVTYVLNNLNRGMGLPDAYPFVLQPSAIDKLRFIHDVIHSPRPAPIQEPVPVHEPAPDNQVPPDELPAPGQQTAPPPPPG
ncbi:MAG TPA: putative zinc-binding peptidase [Steroidobacteraceae bacterium]|nr:putative zinc-binding peptidase [Steroidobacteraceae bacterium]